MMGMYMLYAMTVWAGRFISIGNMVDIEYFVNESAIRKGRIGGLQVAAVKDRCWCSKIRYTKEKKEDGEVKGEMGVYNKGEHGIGRSYKGSTISFIAVDAE